MSTCLHRFADLPVLGFGRWNKEIWAQIYRTALTTVLVICSVQFHKLYLFVFDPPWIVKGDIGRLEEGRLELLGNDCQYPTARIDDVGWKSEVWLSNGTSAFWCFLDLFGFWVAHVGTMLEQCSRELDIPHENGSALSLLISRPVTGRRGNVTKLANGFFVSAETLEEKYVPGTSSECWAVLELYGIIMNWSDPRWP